LCNGNQRHSKGQARALALGCRPWGHINKLFAVIQNTFLSRNLSQNMLKNAQTIYKIAAASEAEHLKPHLPPAAKGLPLPNFHVVIPEYQL